MTQRKPNFSDIRALIEEHGEAARPILFANEDTYAYSHGGTGFLVRFRGHVLFVTAKHCLENFRRSIKELRVVSDLKVVPRIFYGISYPTRTESYDSDDTDCADFIIAKYNLPNGELCSALTLEEDSFLDPCQLDSPSLLYVRGYPSQLKDIEFKEDDISKIMIQAFLTQARFVELDKTAKHMSVIQFNRSAELASADGLSGSPVYCVVNSQSPKPYLCGLVLRGGTGDTLRILNGRWLGSCLRKYVDDLDAI